MRVLHLFKTYLPEGFAGVERVIFELAEGAASRGIEVDVLSLSPRPSPEPIVVGRHLSHQARQDAYVASTGFSLSLFPMFARLARQADIVHYHFPWPFMDVVGFATRVDRPSVVTYHSDIVRQKALLRLYRPLMHRFLARADAIVATSPNYAGSSSVLQQYADRVITIPIGISDDRSERATEADIDALRHRVPERFFLFVGALRYYKGMPFLLEAARKSGLPVVVAGEGELRSAVVGAGLPNLTYLGRVTDREKRALLELSSAFVFPSHLRSEAFGVSLVEAAIAGRAMISCEMGTGTSYVNLDGETGLVVPPADPDALAAAMQWLWSNPAEAVRMGRQARARYEALFKADRMVDAYVDLYRRLLSGET